MRISHMADIYLRRRITREFSKKRIAVFDGERLARAYDALILIAPHIRCLAEGENLAILQLINLHIYPGKLPRVARHTDRQDTVGIERHKLVWRGRKSTPLRDRQIGFRQHVIMADEVIDMQAQDKVPCIRLPHIDTPVIRIPIHITRCTCHWPIRNTASRLLAERVRPHTAVLRNIEEIQPCIIGLVADVEFIIFNLDLVRLRFYLFRSCAVMRAQVVQKLVDSRNLCHILECEIIERVAADAVIKHVLFR